MERRERLHRERLCDGDPARQVRQRAKRSAGEEIVCGPRKLERSDQGEPTDERVRNLCRIEGLHDSAELGMEIKRHEPNIPRGVP